MTALPPALAIAALLGSALVGGIFFAFSSFVMGALARLPATAGVAAMQSINVVVLNPWFLGVFLGTAALAPAAALAALATGEHTPAWYYAGAAACYLAGTFLVTAWGNVPLNRRLAQVDAATPAAGVLWTHYLRRWTRWNHLRTASALAAALLLSLGLSLGPGS